MTQSATGISRNTVSTSPMNERKTAMTGKSPNAGPDDLDDIRNVPDEFFGYAELGALPKSWMPADDLRNAARRLESEAARLRARAAELEDDHSPHAAA